MENVRLGEGLMGVRLLVSLFSSRAVVNPITVTMMAIIFRYKGMVITWMLVGGMFSDSRNPARMLP